MNIMTFMTDSNFSILFSADSELPPRVPNGSLNVEHLSSSNEMRLDKYVKTNLLPGNIHVHASQITGMLKSSYLCIWYQTEPDDVVNVMLNIIQYLSSGRDPGGDGVLKAFNRIVRYNIANYLTWELLQTCLRAFLLFSNYLRRFSPSNLAIILERTDRILSPPKNESSDRSRHYTLCQVDHLHCTVILVVMHIVKQ